MKILYLAKGTIRVTANGYWFTAGGEKGSFGYYPHLKDKDGYPIFSDTQIHGDLKMSANWLAKLNAVDTDDLKRIQNDINCIFGKEGHSTSALLRVSDLALKEKPNDPQSLFSVKPRIQINDDTGTVEEHMLVEMELSYLDGCMLESEIYLGYSDKKETLDKYKKLVEAAAGFLSGFGAFRSRGYCRGEVWIEWKEDDVINAKDIDLPEINHPSGKNFPKIYFLTALVNFRNKPIEPGTAQVVDSQDFISSEQFRGWFVRAYHAIFNKYPSPEEMATIGFPMFYPSDADKKILGYPPAITTQVYDSGEIEDMWGKKKGSEKTKALSGFFITDKPGISDKIGKEKRFRNVMTDIFATKKTDGLFVQELIRKGTGFGGKIIFKKPDSLFSKQAWFVLTKLKPIINGALFESGEPSDVTEVSAPNKPFLVVSPIPFAESYFDKDNADKEKIHSQITLTTLRRYNTTLSRPRRNRIVIGVGSVLKKEVLKEEDRGKTLQWSGFGEKDIGTIPKKEKKPIHIEYEEIRCKCKNKISRSQAGLLREYLHPNIMKEDDIRQHLERRIKKYEEKKEEKLASLLGEILKHLNSQKIEGMKKFIEKYLDELSICWYLEKREK